MPNQPVIKRKRGQHGPTPHGGYNFLTKGEGAKVEEGGLS